LIAWWVGLALARVATVFADITLEFTLLARSRALLRKNLINSILLHPGGSAVPGSPGEAVSRFRGDIEAVGRLDELLETNEEMQRLWTGDMSASDPDLPA
jgi:hypothetical protein